MNARAVKLQLVRRVPMPADRFAGEPPPATLHDWTLVDIGPFRVAGKIRLQSRIACKCSRQRFIDRAAWCGRRRDVPKRCKRCLCRDARKVKGYAAPSPLKSPVTPHWGRR